MTITIGHSGTQEHNVFAEVAKHFIEDEFGINCDIDILYPDPEISLMDEDSKVIAKFKRIPTLDTIEWCIRNFVLTD